MTVKKTMVALVAYLTANDTQIVGELLNDPAFISLVEAKRGGAVSDDNWLIVEDQRVGRKCAMLHAWYPYDNTSKEVSHFYKNGSYHIVIEKLKNLSLKAHKTEQLIALTQLEDDMMEGKITPKEWKQAKDNVLVEHTFTISDELRTYLVELTGGKATKEELAESMSSFIDISEAVDAYLKEAEAELFPKDEETVA